MLSDKSLQKISFLITILGIIALFFITQYLEPQNIMIKDIDESMIGDYVFVNGTLKSIRITENIFFDLCDTDKCIKVVMFEKNAKKQPSLYSLKNMDKLQVTGRINLYKNRLEIIAENIKILNNNT